ncbi:uncharacterized protein LOC127095252 [Lathyrus oleraceus]|uniref:uncharacterized protein LOC127095252 n=1 Tax=Pisum sativum TaxID=3888 RepID=UPI0021CFF981|nr:uncharacterized protein LOC127095252 [Pisum sativum]
MASRVRPTLFDNELVDIFMGTLQGLYFEKMIGSSSTNFADMVTIGERVKSGLKSGKITDTTAPRTINKRPYGGFAKKKEGEANAVTAKARPRYQVPTAPMPYYPYQYVAAAQYQQPFFQYQLQKDNRQSTPAQRNPNQQYNRAQNQGNNFGNRPQFDKIPVLYSELVPYLVHVGAIIPKELPVATPQFRANHDPNASCIQDLINQNILTFTEEKPNVKTNPLPNHSGASVNAVIEEVNAEVVLKVEELKGCVQALMDQGLIQFSKAQAAEGVAVIEPITIAYRKKKVEAPPKRSQLIHFRVPTLFPYQNTKAVPWSYETTAYLGGKEICIPDTEIVNITGAGGMTRSGRVFAPKYTPRVCPTPTVVSPKEKATPTPTPQAGTTVLATPTVTTAPVLTRVIDNDKDEEAKVSKGKWSMVEKEQSGDHKKSITFEESQEFLKLITKSDFKIVEQLNQTPSKISILSLLLSSEAHRKALLKVLNTAHVMQDITVDQFDDVVANITATRYLGFNEVELPPEGKAHDKALHISVTCTDSLLSRVLVDTGSSLDVLPKSTLSQLLFKGPEMRTSALIVRAFDGSRRKKICWSVNSPPPDMFKQMRGLSRFRSTI